MNPTDIVMAAKGTNQSPMSRSPRDMSCRVFTNVTMSVASSDIPASEARIRRGNSDAASVYRPTMPIRKPISAGVMAIDTSTTAIGHRRRTSSTEPASRPNTTPAATGIPASLANGMPSNPHSSADATARLTSNTALRRLAHHHGPPRAVTWSSPVVVMPSSLKAPAAGFPVSFPDWPGPHSVTVRTQYHPISLELLNRSLFDPGGLHSARTVCV